MRLCTCRHRRPRSYCGYIRLYILTRKHLFISALFTVVVNCRYFASASTNVKKPSLVLFDALHSSVQHVNKRGIGRASHMWETYLLVIFTHQQRFCIQVPSQILKCATITSKTFLRHQSNIHNTSYMGKASVASVSENESAAEEFNSFWRWYIELTALAIVPSMDRTL